VSSALLSVGLLGSPVMFPFPEFAFVAAGVDALFEFMVSAVDNATRAFAAIISSSWNRTFLGFAEAVAENGFCGGGLEDECGGGGGDMIAAWA